MKKLLIVVDMQNDFVTGSLGFPDAKNIIPCIKEKIEKCIQNGDDLVFTLDTHHEDYLSTLEGKNLPTPHCIENTFGHQIVQELDYEFASFKLFKKNTFPSLELANFLKDKDYQEVELCGLVSHICVLTNAIMVKASLPNARIVISRNATSSYDLALQEKCFDVLKGIQIEVI